MGCPSKNGMGDNDKHEQLLASILKRDKNIASLRTPWLMANKNEHSSTLLQLPRMYTTSTFYSRYTHAVLNASHPPSPGNCSLVRERHYTFDRCKITNCDEISNLKRYSKHQSRKTQKWQQWSTKLYRAP